MIGHLFISTKCYVTTGLPLLNQSAKYIKKTQHFIDQITVSVPRSVPKKKPILTQKKEGLEVLVIGSNASKNDNLFVPRKHISIDTYKNQKLYSYFLWASKREHVQITIKEKKADSSIFSTDGARLA